MYLKYDIRIPIGIFHFPTLLLNHIAGVIPYAMLALKAQIAILPFHSIKNDTQLIPLIPILILNLITCTAIDCN